MSRFYSEKPKTPTHQRVQGRKNFKKTFRLRKSSDEASRNCPTDAARGTNLPIGASCKELGIKTSAPKSDGKSLGQFQRLSFKQATIDAAMQPNKRLMISLFDNLALIKHKQPVQSTHRG